MKFSSDDVDNDLNMGNSCALLYKGAWWYNTCLPSQFNAPYPSGLELNSDKDKDQLSFMFSEMKLHKSAPGTFKTLRECKI